MLTSPLEQLCEIRMIFKVLIHKSSSIILSLKISVKLEGKDVTVAHLGAILFLLNNLLLNVIFEEIEKAGRHFKLELLLTHQLRNEVVVASLVQEL